MRLSGRWPESRSLGASHVVETLESREDGFHLMAQELVARSAQTFAISTCMIPAPFYSANASFGNSCSRELMLRPIMGAFPVIIRTMNPSCCGPSSVYCFLKQYSCY